MIKLFESKRVTRVTLVTDGGVVYEKYDAYEHGVELYLQDDGRTLKLFPARQQPAEAPRQSVLRATCGSIYSHRGHTFPDGHGARTGCDGVVR